MIDELCEQFGYSRKRAIKLLNARVGWGGDPGLFLKAALSWVPHTPFLSTRQRVASPLTRRAAPPAGASSLWGRRNFRNATGSYDDPNLELCYVEAVPRPVAWFTEFAMNRKLVRVSMKSVLTILCAAAISSPAALIPLGLSPAGTDAAPGLSSTNEVSLANPSTGSGDVISAGIAFDTDSKELKFAIGYGSAAGFTDLTGAATAMHIHSGGAGTNGGVVVSLVPFSFPAADPAKGGVIFGRLAFPADKVADLLAGWTYVNVHTALNPSGEIRGQLVPLVNAPPTATCGSAATVECGAPVTVTVLVSDPEGGPLTVTWAVNGTPAQTNTIPAGSPGATTPVLLTTTLPVGTNGVAVLVTDEAGNTASCSTPVIVEDTTPPVITAVGANPSVLWPPNHKMVPITLRVQATDSCSRTAWKITRVTSSEPVNGLGDGDTGPDWEIIGDHDLKLRAERSGKGDGRIYSIVIRAVDAEGNVSEPRTVTVTVPKSQGNTPTK